MELILELMHEVRELRKQLSMLAGTQVPRGYYTTVEFARLIGQKRKTVTDNLAAGRLNGVKRRDGHGRSKIWAIPHAELERYQREGLLEKKPTDRRR